MIPIELLDDVHNLRVMTGGCPTSGNPSQKDIHERTLQVMRSELNEREAHYREMEIALLKFKKARESK
jgi:hypothetical protein